jgi:hypothetical protein
MPDVARIPGSQYTTEQRREAAMMFALHGNLTHVEKTLGIPDSTLSAWTKQPWWETLMGEIRNDANQLIQARALKTLNKAFDELDERLENGDECATKEGVMRLKVKARDAAFIAAVVFDKRQILMRQPTSITHNDTSGLAEELTSWMRSQKQRLVTSQSQTIEGQSTEVKE